MQLHEFSHLFWNTNSAKIPSATAKHSPSAGRQGCTGHSSCTARVGKAHKHNGWAFLNMCSFHLPALHFLRCLNQFYAPLMKDYRSSFGGPAMGLIQWQQQHYHLQYSFHLFSPTEKAQKVPENSSTVNFARSSSTVNTSVTAAKQALELSKGSPLH